MPEDLLDVTARATERALALALRAHSRLAFIEKQVGIEPPGPEHGGSLKSPGFLSRVREMVEQQHPEARGARPSPGRSSLPGAFVDLSRLRAGRPSPMNHAEALAEAARAARFRKST